MYSAVALAASLAGCAGTTGLYTTEYAPVATPSGETVQVPLNVAPEMGDVEYDERVTPLPVDIATTPAPTAADEPDVPRADERRAQPKSDAISNVADGTPAAVKPEPATTTPQSDAPKKLTPVIVNVPPHRPVAPELPENGDDAVIKGGKAGKAGGGNVASVKKPIVGSLRPMPAVQTPKPTPSKPAVTVQTPKPTPSKPAVTVQTPKPAPSRPAVTVQTPKPAPSRPAVTVQTPKPAPSKPAVTVQTPKPTPSKPAVTVQTPKPTPSKPAVTVQTPKPTPSKPAVTVQTPKPAPSKPAVTVQTPKPTPSKPAVTVQTPKPTPSKPAVTVQTPKPTPSKPAVTVQTPKPTPSKPAVTVQTPKPTPSKPTVTVETPKPTPSKPVVTVQTPKPTPSKPAATVQTPKPTPSKPAATVQTPKPTPSKPAATVQTPKPTPSKPAATVQTPKPTPSKPTVTVQTPKPTPSKPTVTVQTPKPTPSKPTVTVETPKPTPSKPAVTVETPKPTPSKPAVTVETPKPTPSKPAVTVQTPKPTPSKPAATVQTPKPATSKPAATLAASKAIDVSALRAQPLLSVPQAVHSVSIDQKGNVYLTHDRSITQVQANGRNRKWSSVGRPRALLSVDNGKFLACDVAGRALVWLDNNGNTKDQAVSSSDGHFLRAPNSLVMDSSGGVYFTDPGFARIRNPIGKIHYMSPSGSSKAVIRRLAYPDGIALNQERTHVLVVESQSDHVLAFQILAPGKLGPKRIFGRLPLVRSEQKGIASGLAVDDSGNVYVGRGELGQVAVLNKHGRALGSVQVPDTDVMDVAIGGRNGDRLIVAGVELGSKNRGRVWTIDLDPAR